MGQTWPGVGGLLVEEVSATDGTEIARTRSEAMNTGDQLRIARISRKGIGKGGGESREQRPGVSSL